MKKSPRQSIIFGLILIAVSLVFLNGCSDVDKSNTSQDKTETNNPTKKSLPSDNLEGLSELIKLPVVPEYVVWSEEEKYNKKRLTAVFEYKAEDMPAIQNVVEKYKQAESSEVGVEDWFPEDLKGQAQLSGAEMLKGTGYGANEFFNIPYGSGKITKIEGTNYFVLELQTN